MSAVSEGVKPETTFLAANSRDRQKGDYRLPKPEMAPRAGKRERDDDVGANKRQRSDEQRVANGEEGRRAPRWDLLPWTALTVVAKNLGWTDERYNLACVCKSFNQALGSCWQGGDTLAVLLKAEDDLASFVSWAKRSELSGLRNVCVVVNCTPSADLIAVLGEVVDSNLPSLETLAVDFWRGPIPGPEEEVSDGLSAHIMGAASSSKLTRVSFFGGKSVRISSSSIKLASACNCYVEGTCNIEVLRAYGTLLIDQGEALKRLRLLHFVSEDEDNVSELALQLFEMESLEEFHLEIARSTDWQPYQEPACIDMGNWSPGKSLEYLSIIGPVDMSYEAALRVQAIPNLLLAGDSSKLQENLLIAAKDCRMRAQMRPSCAPYQEFEFARGGFVEALRALPCNPAEDRHEGAFAVKRFAFLRARNAKESALAQWEAPEYFPSWCPYPCVVQWSS